MTRKVAAFDFDGTLTRRDSFLPFLAYVAGWPKLGFALASAAPYARSRDKSKERVLTATLRGRPHAAVVELGARYGTELATDKVKPEMRERLAWHRAEGHEIVIVSASLDVYLEAARAVLRIDGLVCSALEVDADGKCTGRLAGPNCRGEEKAVRLRAYLGPEPFELWAYGDSAGDDALLDLADHPTRV